jgi:hypothetical protein
MGSLKMWTPAIIFLISVILQGVSGKTCYYTPTFNTQLSASCDWGCCYTYIYPCCDAPLYADPVFIVPMSIGGFIGLVSIIAAIIVIRRRRLQHATVMATPHYMGPIVGGHPNYAYPPQQYLPPPMYTPQATNETTPVNTAQSYSSPGAGYDSMPPKH